MRSYQLDAEPRPIPKPALTANEWAVRSHANMGDGAPSAYLTPEGSLTVDVWVDGEDADDIAQVSLDVDRHAIAALALHGQPFGFTRGDVEALVMASDLLQNVEVLRPLLDSLADRIDALLPPAADNVIQFKARDIVAADTE